MFKKYKIKVDIESLISEYINTYFKSGKINTKSDEISIHFIGCGGIGMCGLSLLCKQFGFKVTGSDLNSSKNTEYLMVNDITVNIKHSPNNLPKNNNSIVVFSSAVSKKNIELKKAMDNGIPCYTRGEFLAFISSHYKTVVSIAGSHGKTTVTSMLVHIFKNTSFPNLGYLIGGWPIGKSTLGNIGDGNIFIVEVDESDLSLTLFKSHLGVILNIDDDHAWNVGGNDKLSDGFKTFAKRSELIIYADEKIDTFLKDISCQKFKVDFEQINKFNSDKIYGDYQVKNAQTAMTIALRLGVEKQHIIQCLKDFQGVERRMQKAFSNNIFTIFEDYAHHPSEIKAALEAVKIKYPEKKLVVVFQPHRYARLKHYLNRFSIELKSADKTFVIPTFSAWSDKEDISEQELVAKIGNNAQFIKGSWDTIADKIYLNLHFNNCIILVLGAGDVNHVIPKLITQIISNAKN